MKLNSIALMQGVILAAGLLSPALHAQNNPNICSNAAAAGSYTVSCSGWVAAGPAGSLVPIAMVGVAKGDAAGNWSGTTTNNIGGFTVIPGVAVSGKTTVNSDCTGSITYNKGTPAELNITYAMNPKTEETFGMVTNTGMVVSCVLKKISNDRGQGSNDSTPVPK